MGQPKVGDFGAKKKIWEWDLRLKSIGKNGGYRIYKFYKGWLKYYYFWSLPQPP